MASFRSSPVLSLPGRLRCLRSAARFFLFLWLASTFPGAADEDFEELKSRWRERDKWTRKSAIEGLARLGTPEAWELVIEGLGDERGEVADTAQWVLGGLEDPQLVSRLTRRSGLKSKDPWIRKRVTEVLGRLGRSEDLRSLLGQLDDRDVEVRSATLQALARIARADGLSSGDLDRVCKGVKKRSQADRDPHIRAQALGVWMGLVGEEGFDKLRRAVRAREPAVRAMAASLLVSVYGKATADAAAIALVDLVEDPSRAVRTRAIEAAARIGRPATVSLLVERLTQEPNPRLRWRIVQLLRGLSGTKHGRDPRPWRDWLKKLPVEWSGRSVPLLGIRAGPGDRSATFAGLPILSNRLTILIDLSGSIWQERADGKSKKEKVDERLREALHRLPEDARFNLIPFTGKPIPWKEQLVEARPRNVASALRFFEGLRESGSGNIWDAIQLALQDPETDTIILLTDGAPTGGRRHRLELIVPLLLLQNATRAVAFDLVLVDASRRLQGFWEKLARGSGGHLLSIEL